MSQDCSFRFPESIISPTSGESITCICLESNLNINDFPAKEELQVKTVIVNSSGNVTTRIPQDETRQVNSSCYVCTGHAEMNIPDLIDGLITCQTTLQYHVVLIRNRAYQKSWGGGGGKYFLSSLPLPLLALILCLPQFSRRQKQKMFQICRKPNQNASYSMQAIIE